VANLMIIPLDVFNVILGMDWLSQYRVVYILFLEDSVFTGTFRCRGDLCRWCYEVLSYTIVSIDSIPLGEKIWNYLCYDG
jgi:hypothetical protein